MFMLQLPPVFPVFLNVIFTVKASPAAFLTTLSFWLVAKVKELLVSVTEKVTATTTSTATRNSTAYLLAIFSFQLLHFIFSILVIIRSEGKFYKKTR
jgi:hypothetical protein